MSNRRWNGDLASKGKTVPESDKANQLSVGVSEMNLGSEQGDGGGWEVFVKKSKNKGGAASKPSAPQNSRSRTLGQGRPEVVQQSTGSWNYNGSGGRGGRGYGNNSSVQPTDSRRPLGRGNPRPQAYNRGFEQNQYHYAPAPVARAPLSNGWNWQGRAGYNGNQVSMEAEQTNDEDINDVHVEEEDDDDDDDDDDDAFDDSEDELFSDDEYDSGASKKSHSTIKKNKWFKAFFELLDSLSLDQINELQRQWHCPACQGGPGAIDWFMGMQPLITHAKTVGATRVKLHRKFAEVLSEELSLKGASVIPSGGMFGKWKGLMSEEKDYEIVWPPMVIIMNTQLEQDDNDKWIGMGNQELLEYFKTYEAAKARHAYGPQGHRGMSLLIFENSAKGYLEAERLHRHFMEEGRDRDAWDRRRKLFHYSGGGQRQLYGYMAVKEDVDTFNRHSHGKAKLRFELRSYQEMVVSQIKQMSKDNQQLLWFKNKAAKEQMHSKALEESFGQLTQKLQKTMEENIIVRQRSKTHHEQNKEALEYQAEFFKEQIQMIMEDRDAKEEHFEKQQQEKKRHNMETNAEESTLRSEEVIKLQDKEREQFEEEREKLIKEQDEKMAAMKKRHGEEEVELEREYNAALAKLMAKYSDPGLN